ncbi:putative Poly [ADP-ribose] polymerase protein, partial [Naja naja]
MQIEAAAQHQRLHELTINNRCYKVDPSKMQAVDDQECIAPCVLKSRRDVNAVFTLGLISVLQNQNWKVAICKGLQNCFLFICKDNLITTIPEEWDAMEETMRVKVVELKPEMVEYKKVQDIFNLTCKGYTIQK